MNQLKYVRVTIGSVIFVLICSTVWLSCAYSADPITVPSPVPLPVPGFGGWVSGQGGWLAALVALIASYNTILTALHTICEKLKLKEPGWVQTAGAWGVKILGYLTANTTTKLDTKVQE